ncbi:MAG: hypothetical protein AB1816_18525 [Bacillota bacterium]
MARQLVEMQGGRIWVESEPGKGATFYVAFPPRAAGGSGTTGGPSTAGGS